MIGKPAIQFSGGKDSLALIHLFRDVLGDFTVYWANAGDPFPETMRIVESVRALAPDFVEVTSDVVGWQGEFGHPVDIVPSCATQLGHMAGGSGIKLVDRYVCCWNNIIKPLHERMIADGVTTILRGVKKRDHYRTDIQPGQAVDGITFIYPIWDWTDHEVLQFLRDAGADVPEYYDHRVDGMDCRCCSAWWDKRHAEYTRMADPEQWERTRDVLVETRRMIRGFMDQLDVELGD